MGDWGVEKCVNVLGLTTGPELVMEFWSDFLFSGFFLPSSILLLSCNYI